MLHGVQHITLYYNTMFEFTMSEIITTIIININPLTAMLLRVQQMTLQPFSSVFHVLHCPLRPAELQACQFPTVIFPTRTRSQTSARVPQTQWPHVRPGDGWTPSGCTSSQDSPGNEWQHTTSLYRISHHLRQQGPRLPQGIRTEAPSVLLVRHRRFQEETTLLGCLSSVALKPGLLLCVCVCIALVNWFSSAVV